ncbi:hypothetical protein [Actinophytocola sp.]|uniref:hypothetical protein n=1 Tax=Actinophytocola sp. TaxID=1872138 RepID=UPI003D6BB5E0
MSDDHPGWPETHARSSAMAAQRDTGVNGAGESVPCRRTSAWGEPLIDCDSVDDSVQGKAIAAAKLANILVDLDELDELRARADRHAVAELGIRTREHRDDLQAPERLVRLLIAQGDLAEAHREQAIATYQFCEQTGAALTEEHAHAHERLAGYKRPNTSCSPTRCRRTRRQDPSRTQAPRSAATWGRWATPAS